MFFQSSWKIRLLCFLLLFSCRRFQQVECIALGGIRSSSIWFQCKFLLKGEKILHHKGRLFAPATATTTWRFLRSYHQGGVTGWWCSSVVWRTNVNLSRNLNLKFNSVLGIFTLAQASSSAGSWRKYRLLALLLTQQSVKTNLDGESTSPLQQTALDNDNDALDNGINEPTRLVHYFSQMSLYFSSSLCTNMKIFIIFLLFTSIVSSSSWDSLVFQVMFLKLFTNHTAFCLSTVLTSHVERDERTSHGVSLGVISSNHKLFALIHQSSPGNRECFLHNLNLSIHVLARTNIKHTNLCHTTTFMICMCNVCP